MSMNRASIGADQGRAGLLCPLLKWEIDRKGVRVCVCECVYDKCVCVCVSVKLINYGTKLQNACTIQSHLSVMWSVLIARLIGIRRRRRSASDAIGTARRALKNGSREAQELRDNIAQAGIGIAIARRGAAEGGNCGQDTGGQIVGNVADRAYLGRDDGRDQGLEILDGHRVLDVPLLVLLNVRSIQLLDYACLRVQKVIDLLQLQPGEREREIRERDRERDIGRLTAIHYLLQRRIRVRRFSPRRSRREVFFCCAQDRRLTPPAMEWREENTRENWQHAENFDFDFDYRCRIRLRLRLRIWTEHTCNCAGFLIAPVNSDAAFDCATAANSHTVRKRKRETERVGEGVGREVDTTWTSARTKPRLVRLDPITSSLVQEADREKTHE